MRGASHCHCVLLGHNPDLIWANIEQQQSLAKLVYYLGANNCLSEGKRKCADCRLWSTLTLTRLSHSLAWPRAHVINLFTLIVTLLQSVWNPKSILGLWAPVEEYFWRGSWEHASATNLQSGTHFLLLEGEFCCKERSCMGDSKIPLWSYKPLENIIRNVQQNSSALTWGVTKIWHCLYNHLLLTLVVAIKVQVSGSGRACPSSKSCANDNLKFLILLRSLWCFTAVTDKYEDLLLWCSDVVIHLLLM